MFAIGTGVISATLLLLVLKKYLAKLPEEWKNSTQLKNFRLGLNFLLAYLSIIFTGECISIYLAIHGIYNSYVMSINVSLATPFLFGFFYLHTPRMWKRYTYFALYIALLSYFIAGGYFHPRSILSGNCILAVYIPYFLASFLFLINLLLDPKSTFFKFNLKISLSNLFYSLITLIITSFHWYSQDITKDVPVYIQSIDFANNHLYYFSLGLIFALETYKLRFR